MCLGWVSKKWSAAAVQYNTKAIWQCRNEIVNGTTVEEHAQHLISTLHTKATTYYAEYETMNHIVLAHHQYLFTTRSLEECLKASYDTLSSWICSLEDEATDISTTHSCWEALVPSVQGSVIYLMGPSMVIDTLKIIIFFRVANSVWCTWNRTLIWLVLIMG